MKEFTKLTMRGQARRLRRMALAALEHYDLDVKNVRLLTNNFNCIFRVDTADGLKYVLRVNLPQERTRQEILSETTWLAALRRDTDLNVPKPLTTRDGALLTTVEMDDVPEPRHCVVFSWMPGPNLSEKISPENLHKLGMLTARLHQHADTFEPPQGFGLKQYTTVFPFNTPVVLFEQAYNDLVPPERRTIFQQAIEHVQALLDKLNADQSQLRVLHADLHQWNVKVFQDQLYALDFDDTMWGYPVQDIGIALYYFQGYETYPTLREAYQEGYTSVRAWPEQYLAEIDTFIAARGLDLANFIMQDHIQGFREQAPGFLARTEERLRVFLNKNE